MSATPIATFSVDVEWRRDGFYMVARTGGAWGNECKAFGPYDEDQAHGWAGEFRSTCLRLGGEEIPPGKPN